MQNEAKTGFAKSHDYEDMVSSTWFQWGAGKSSQKMVRIQAQKKNAANEARLPQGNSGGDEHKGDNAEVIRANALENVMVDCSGEN